jgi:hypothetical protein
VGASGLPIFWGIFIPGIPWGIIRVCCMGTCMVNEGWVPMGNGMAPAIIGAAEYEGNADICRVVVTMKKSGGRQINDHNCTTQTQFTAHMVNIHNPKILPSSNQSLRCFLLRIVQAGYLPNIPTTAQDGQSMDCGNDQ